MTRRLAVAGLALLLSAHWTGAAPAQAAAPAKPLAYLVLTPSAQEGDPELPPWTATFAYADPKLQARLGKLGFTGVVGAFAPGLTLDYLKQFNVVVLLGGEGGDGGSGRLMEILKEKRQLLLKYVEEGGGLLVLRSPGYQFGKDIEDLNAWLKPCGIEILPEQVVDDESCYTPSGGNRIYWTDNFADHPVARDVKGMFYPDAFSVYATEGYTDFTSPVKAGSEWKAVMSGRKSARSLATVKGKENAPPLPGQYPSAPPLLAARDYGKGRIAVWPIATTFVWQDGYHMFWERGAFMDGTVQRMKGDGARLMENLMSYLAEPSKGVFGGYAARKKEVPPEAGFARIDWDAIQPRGASMPVCYVGLIGAQTALSCGQGEPEAFVRAAKEAGYQFIAFTEDLAKLNPDAFAKLKDICAKHSDKTFKAYPGFTYRDDSGNAWATFSDRLRWPDKAWWSTNYPGRLTVNNTLSRGCQWPPVVMLKPHANPEKPWLQGNFKVISVFTYENGKLADDALDVYRRLETDRFILAPVAVHIVTTPEAVTQARATGYQTYIRWPDSDVVDALSGSYAMYKGNYVWFRSSFVSEGPLIEDAQIVNFGTTDLAIPGCDRFRVHIRAASPAGLKETAILNGDAERPWRRFLPGGAREFEQTIDAFHDQEHNLIVTATDIHGKKAIGWGCWTQVQENSFPRCSDNFNTMPRGKWFALPKDMQLPRGFECYSAVRNMTYFGLPSLQGMEESLRPAVEYYPFHVSRFVSMIDCQLEDHYPPTASANPDVTDKPECATANTQFAGRVRHTLFTPWNDGPMVELVEGDLVLKRDYTVGEVAVFRPNGLQRALTLSASEESGAVYAAVLSQAPSSAAGRLPLYGFTALFPQMYYGSLGTIALQPGLQYIARGGGDYGALYMVLADAGKKLKAGDHLTYRYLGIISQFGGPSDNRFVADVVTAMGLGRQPAYALTPSSGTVLDSTFILTLRARNYGFSGAVSEAKLPLQLPVRVEGLNPRWDAGIWYKGTVTRMIPEYVVNEIGERYVERRRKTEKDPLIHIPVLEDGTAVLQIETDVGAKDLFIGNMLICDRPEVGLMLVDRRPGKSAFVAHNPTDRDIRCRVRPAKGFTLLGGFDKKVSVPAGSSAQVPIP